MKGMYRVFYLISYFCLLEKLCPPMSLLSEDRLFALLHPCHPRIEATLFHLSISVSMKLSEHCKHHRDYLPFLVASPSWSSCFYPLYCCWQLSCWMFRLLTQKWVLGISLWASKNLIPTLHSVLWLVIHAVLSDHSSCDGSKPNNWCS